MSRTGSTSAKPFHAFLDEKEKEKQNDKYILDAKTSKRERSSSSDGRLTSNSKKRSAFRHSSKERSSTYNRSYSSSSASSDDDGSWRTRRSRSRMSDESSGKHGYDRYMARRSPIQSPVRNSGLDISRRKMIVRRMGIRSSGKCGYDRFMHYHRTKRSGYPYKVPMEYGNLQHKMVQNYLDKPSTSFAVHRANDSRATDHTATNADSPSMLYSSQSRMADIPSGNDGFAHLGSKSEVGKSYGVSIQESTSPRGMGKNKESNTSG